MAKPKKKTIWPALLSSGIGVALFTFVASKGWELYRHRGVSPKYVDASVRVENDQLLVFVRNRSDDPLDLTGASISIDDPALVSTAAMGAYPDVSKVYTVSRAPGSSRLEIVDDRLVVRLQIAQAIAPSGADQFGFALKGLAGPVDLSSAKIDVELEDMKGNRYRIRSPERN